jgi:outer membrane autotransporter protein
LAGTGVTTAQNILSAVNHVVQARSDANRGLSSGDIFYGNKNVWLKPFGSWARQGDMDGVAGYKAKISGLAFGADAAVSDSDRVGVSFAYASADVSGNSSSAPAHQDTDAYVLIGYGSHQLTSDSALTWQMDIGQNDNHGQRDILFASSTAKSGYRTRSYHAGVGLDKTIALNERTDFTPSIHLDYTHLRDSAYSETGAGLLNLDVKARTSEQLILLGDAKFTHRLNDSASFVGNLGIGYDTLTKRSSVVAAFAGATDVEFTTTGADPKPWLLRGGLGYVYTPKHGPEVTARYDIEQRQGYTNQTVSAKLRWAF